jgi:hypothetical protein
MTPLVPRIRSSDRGRPLLKGTVFLDVPRRRDLSLLAVVAGIVALFVVGAMLVVRELVQIDLSDDG